jgi:enoyl-CoA hydratase/carnithine racemase
LSPAPPVTVSRLEGRVALIELNRPEEGNSFTLTMLRELADAVDTANGDPDVRAVVLTGVGRHFSTGASPELLRHLKCSPPVTVQDEVYSLAQGAARRLYSCGKPTVAAISGAAVTLGCEFALQCDFRLVDETASFHEAWVRFGLIPPLGGVALLPQLVGLSLASEIILRGRRIHAQEAVRIGLANEAVPAGELMERAGELAAELAALPPHAYRFAKASLHRGLHPTMEAELTAASMAQSLLMSTEDFRRSVEELRTT